MLEKRKGECEEGSKAILRNREGEQGRVTCDVVSRMEEKEKRIRKEDSRWQRQGSFKKERWLRKVGVLRRNGQERERH